MTKITLESLFGDENIDVDCPQCQKHFQVKLKEVMNDHSIVRCPHCQVDIQLEHDDTTKNTLRDGNEAVKEFDKSLKNLEKTFKKFGK